MLMIALFQSEKKGTPETAFASDNDLWSWTTPSLTCKQGGMSVWKQEVRKQAQGNTAGGAGMSLGTGQAHRKIGGDDAGGKVDKHVSR
jgi:hypothetical protein